MAHPILMPKPGQMTEECVLITWHVREGDRVRKGDPLFEIETDKSTIDVESFDEGVILRRLVAEGDTVPVNAVCAYIGRPGEALDDGAAVAGPSPVAVPAPSDGVDVRRVPISPRAARRAARERVDVGRLTGTGPGGRIVERDVSGLLASPDAGLASPDAGLASPDAGEEPSLDAGSEGVPLPRMRQVIADRLTGSWRSTPHFTVTVRADVTRLLLLRDDVRRDGRALSVTDFVVAAVARTLPGFPPVNGRTDGRRSWENARVHVGLAVSLPQGLLVPVVRDADRLGLGTLHDTMARLVVGAREGTLRPAELTGSTFTVSNLGMFGVEEFSAIVNPGEAAILAVSSAVRRPVVTGDGIGIRTVMNLTLSADHRLVDGELAARFLGEVRRRLADVDGFRDQLVNE